MSAVTSSNGRTLTYEITEEKPASVVVFNRIYKDGGTTVNTSISEYGCQREVPGEIMDKELWLANNEDGGHLLLLNTVTGE